MEILRKKLTRKEFANYLKAKKFGDVVPTSLVLHHTWRPTVESWNGVQTVDALKKYYENLGWSAGPHVFVAPDGIWLFTDMAKVGIHAGEANAVWTQNGILESYSIGVEIVGDYDEKVWEGDVLQNALCCISELKKCLNLYNIDIRFHREFSPKTCPGNAITKEWLERKLIAYEQGQSISNGYDFKFSPEEARKAMELGFLKKVDTETREIVAIGLVRVYEKIKQEINN